MERMTAEQMVRDLFEYPVGNLDDCDRAASATLLCNMMREHAQAEVEAATADLQRRVEKAERERDEVTRMLEDDVHEVEHHREARLLNVDLRLKAERERDEARAERDTLRHSDALIRGATARWITDCSTPVFVQVRNAVDACEQAERERDEARAEVAKVKATATQVLDTFRFCAHHSTEIAAMRFDAIIARDVETGCPWCLKAEVARLREGRDAAYSERNALVAALSKVFPASLEQHDEADASWDPEWRTIVAVDLPTGQATWHIHDREREMFAHLRPRVGYAWDGHTTAEKYARLTALAFGANGGGVARLREAATELLEVADLRGDSDLPHPANDPLEWTARMQEAWDNLRAALAPEAKKETP